MARNRDKRKYKCRDCGETRMVHWIELNRASTPKCMGCGGFMDPFSEGAKADREIGDLNIREHNENRGDLLMRRK